MDQVRPFDRALLRRRRDRAAATLADHDFLFAESGARLCERLDDITRGFAEVLDLGCHTGGLGGLLAARPDPASLVQCDLSPAMATAASRRNNQPGLAADEEALPFADESFDLILSNLSLHWVNDLPGALVQARRCLRPDGVFLASMLGGRTLQELREVMLLAESETAGGAGPHVSPFADVRDLGNLLQRAGFALPVADAETLTVRYEEPLKLLADLRGMGESGALADAPRGFTRRDTLMRAAEIYRDKFADEDGRVPATFEIVTLTAWAPHESQPQPLKPGSATTSLADALAKDPPKDNP